MRAGLPCGLGENNDPRIPHRYDLNPLTTTGGEGVCVKCLNGNPCKRYFSSSAGEGSFVSGPLSGLHTKTTLSSKLYHKNIRYERSTFSLPSLVRVYKVNFSSSTTLPFKNMGCINSTPDNINFNGDNTAILFLPPFQEILDKIESVGDLTLTENVSVLIKYINESNFYKELYNTLNNLDDGGYQLRFFFYTNVVYPNPLLYSFYAVDSFSYSNKLNLMDSKTTSIGYINWVVINFNKINNTGDLFPMIIYIYKAISYHINEFKNKGEEEINLELKTLTFVCKLPGQFTSLKDFKKLSGSKSEFKLTRRYFSSYSKPRPAVSGCGYSKGFVKNVAHDFSIVCAAKNYLLSSRWFSYSNSRCFSSAATKPISDLSFTSSVFDLGSLEDFDKTSIEDRSRLSKVCKNAFVNFFFLEFRLCVTSDLFSRGFINVMKDNICFPNVSLFFFIKSDLNKDIPESLSHNDFVR